MLASELLSTLHLAVDTRQKQFVNLCQNSGHFTSINKLQAEINAIQMQSMSLIGSMAKQGDWELTERELTCYSPAQWA